MKYGSIVLTNDENEIRQLVLAGIQPIVLADDTDQYKYTQFLVASILLPPYESAEADAMGEIQKADQLYMQYLSRPDISKVLTTLVAALYSGKNLALYIPKDESTQFRFGIGLITYMSTVFGINIGDHVGYRGPNGPLFSSVPSVSMNPSYEAARIGAMYAFDMIDLTTFAMEFPEGITPSKDICLKIIMGEGKDFSWLSDAEIIDFVNRYIQSIRMATTQHRICPVMRVR